MGIGVLLVWLSISKLDDQQRQEMLESMKSANFFWLSFSILLGGVSHMSRSIRWQMALKPMGYTPSLPNSFMAVMISYFANLAIPRSGEVARCSILRTYEGVPVQRSFGTVVTERIIDLMMLGLFFTITLLVEFDTAMGMVREKIITPMGTKLEGMVPQGYLPVLLISIAVTLLFFFFMSRKYLRKLKIYHKFKTVLKGFLEGIISIRKLEKPFWYIFHTIVIWVMYYLMTYVCFFSMPETAHLGVGPGLVVFAIGSVAMVISQGGLGAYPLFVSGALLLYGVSDADGAAFGWLVWSAQTAMIIIFGTLSVILLPIVNRKKTITPAATEENGSPEAHTV